MPRSISETPPPQGNPQLCQGCGPLKGPLPVSDRHSAGTGLQKEDNHDRCFQLRFGSSVLEQAGIRLLVQLGAIPMYQLPGNNGIIFWC